MPVEDENFSYALALRQVGAWLDAQRPERFTVIETPTSMTAILLGGIQGPGVHEMAFDREELMRDSLHVAPRRTRRDARWSVSASGRSDLLRALGFELDAAGAAVVMIDELDSGVLASYSYIDPKQGYVWRKQMLTLTPPQIEQIIEAGKRRRSTVRRSLFEGLFGAERKD